MPDGATRVVSLHDMQARPIAKGRLGKPVEFGYKAQFVDNDDGIVLDHNVELGNPPDAPQLAPAIDRIIEQTGRAPRVVTADRGYGEAAVDQQLLDRGVGNVVIPRKGKPGKARRAVEHRPSVPPSGEVADRLRGPGQQPQTAVRVGPHPDRLARRCPDLGRAGHLHQQPGQDRHPHRAGADDQHHDGAATGRRASRPSGTGNDGCGTGRCAAGALRLVRPSAARLAGSEHQAGVRTRSRVESAGQSSHVDRGDLAADPDRGWDRCPARSPRPWPTSSASRG